MCGTRACGEHGMFAAFIVLDNSCVCKASRGAAVWQKGMAITLLMNEQCLEHHCRASVYSAVITIARLAEVTHLM